jgi:hypothetical protein
VLASSCPTSFALYCEPLLRWLLEHGANPSTMSTRAHGSCALPHTPLVDAAELSDPTALRLLLAHGAALDPAAMLHAIGRRRQDNGTATMEVLIEHGIMFQRDYPRHYVWPFEETQLRNLSYCWTTAQIQLLSAQREACLPWNMLIPLVTRI